MHDDFIKRHRQRPDPKFVERLYHQLNSTPTPQRSFSMSKRILRPALLVTLALMLAAALTLTFSPAARAAIQGFFTFNGVTVGVDDQTGKLVTSGNTNAIIEQTDHEVSIQGEKGEIAVAGVAQVVMDGEMVDVTDLLSRYPDLTMPVVPSDYTLQPQGQLMPDGSLVFTWTDPAGHVITYQRSPNSLQSLSPVRSLGSVDGTTTLPADGQTTSSTVVLGAPSYGSSGAEPESGTIIVSSQGGQLLPSAQSTPPVTYYWEAGGYNHMLLAINTSLSEADLQAMQP
jgi:hypothetical protein